MYIVLDKEIWEYFIFLSKDIAIKMNLLLERILHEQNKL